MSKSIEFSDEELTAYLDGECDSTLARNIETSVASDPQVGSQLARLQLDRENLAHAFDQILDTAPEHTPAEYVEGSRQSGFGMKAFGRTAAIMLVCLGAGFGAAQLIRESHANHWHNYVAAYQALYANKTLAHISQSEPAAAEELKRVSAAIGTTIDLTDVNQINLLEYKRAQILAYKGQPLIQLAFLSKLGLPVALCIMQSKRPAETDISVAPMEGMQAAYWSKGGYDFLLIGGADEKLIEQTALQFAAKI